MKFSTNEMPTSNLRVKDVMVGELLMEGDCKDVWTRSANKLVCITEDGSVLVFNEDDAAISNIRCIRPPVGFAVTLTQE